jgi:hypothetical protein
MYRCRIPGLNGNREGERKLLPVVALQLLDREGKRAGVQSSSAVYRKAHPAGDFDKFHVDLDGFPGLSLLKELQLARHPLACPSQGRHTDISKDSLDRAYRHPYVVNASEPELCALGAVRELAALATTGTNLRRSRITATPPALGPAGDGGECA